MRGERAKRPQSAAALWSRLAELGFSPLLPAGVDPVVFVQRLGDRIRHVDAKDGEFVAHSAARSGLLAHGAWDRRDRGFRFRISGWGDVRWRALLTELPLTGYD